MRPFLTSVFRLFLRIFFRRIDVSGLEYVPADAPVVFAANHPNGLVDPLVLLCVAPREVSFLAKAPLFRYPVLGYFVRAFRSIPVYRRQDNTRGTNQQTFAQAHEVLAGGGSVAIFPEGTTHSDPMLRELKTGAARIAIGAALERIVIVPTGIYYTEKQTFRSAVHVAFGQPIEVVPGAVAADGEPDRRAVEELTQQIDDGLDRVTLQADTTAALDLIARAENIVTADDEQAPETEFALRRWFVRGYHYLRSTDPARLARLESQVRQLEGELSRAGLEVHELVPEVRPLVLLRLLISLPLALAGAAIHTPAYALVHVIATALAKREQEMTATYKALASLLLYPATWIGFSAISSRLFGWTAALVALAIAPLLFVFAIRVFEAVDDLIGGARAILHRTFRTQGHQRLVEQRNALRSELLAIAREMN